MAGSRGCGYESGKANEQDCCRRGIAVCHRFLGAVGILDWLGIVIPVSFLIEADEVVEIMPSCEIENAAAQVEAY